MPNSSRWLSPLILVAALAMAGPLLGEQATEPAARNAGEYGITVDAGSTEEPAPADEQARGKTGSRPTPQVTATRQGRVLELNYDLSGANLRDYAAREAAPQFVVTKAGREIGTGSLEYG